MQILVAILEPAWKEKEKANSALNSQDTSILPLATTARYNTIGNGMLAPAPPPQAKFTKQVSHDQHEAE
jgi:hypothetical protein